MTFDCFSFYNELDLLDLRLHQHYDHFDKFVIIEGDRTFAGKPIRSALKDNWDRFKWAEAKIIHVIAKLKENPTSRWENEAIQRDAAIEGLKEAEPNDLIFYGCVDEIYRSEVIDDLKTRRDIAFNLILENFYYYLNGKDILHSEFPTPIAITFSKITNGMHQAWEQRHIFAPYPNAGWHFSFLGGEKMIKEKLEAFSHSEYDTDYHKDPKRLKEIIEKGGDIFERGDHQFSYVPIDDSFPEYLVRNKEKYKHLIKTQ